MGTVEVGQAQLRSKLHEVGMRMTPQRQLVLDAVRELEHSTPEEICRRVQADAPAVNITTVYRNLELLEELGLVLHTHIGHGAPTYSVPEHRHVHLVCHRCGHTDQVPVSLLEGLVGTLREYAGFEMHANHVALSGYCSGCAADEPPAAPQTGSTVRLEGP